ncbi:unnamed protein product [Mycena citricolor]|uniref:Uncharacterized protein n=1 Tax=Mycena citricolor TaxID=2018698 RepID=A0AAD2Q2M4_9AGAR|nr:unnamed protein product [Mycena citricolor]
MSTSQLRARTLSKLELTVSVAQSLKWPATQHSIPTANSLWPQDVSPEEEEKEEDGEDDDDDDLLTIPAHLTPSRLTFSGGRSEYLWRPESRTPNTAHTFGFPLSARTNNTFFDLQAGGAGASSSSADADARSALERHKRRLRRDTTAEADLLRITASGALHELSPAELQAAVAQFAHESVAALLADARAGLGVVLAAGRKDRSRWMAEQRVAALEALQAQIARPAVAAVGPSGGSAQLRRETNLVRFLAARRGGEAKLVPVFTRKRDTRGRPQELKEKQKQEQKQEQQNPRYRPVADETPERPSRSYKSPMKLQVPSPEAASPRDGWSWETRVRSVLMTPEPKPEKRTRSEEAPPEPTRSPSLRIRTKTPSSDGDTRMSFMTLSTPTSGNFSPIRAETPLTEEDEEQEEEEERYEDEDYEDYPTFRPHVVQSDAFTPAWQPRRPPTPSSRLAPISTKAPEPMPYLTQDAQYPWLADPSTWGVSPSPWHGDGWVVTPASASTASTVSPSDLATPLSALPRRPPVPSRSQTLPLTPASSLFSSSSSSSSSSPRRTWSREPESYLQVSSLDTISESHTGPKASASSRAKPLPPMPSPSPKASRSFFSGLLGKRASREDDGSRTKMKKKGSLHSLRNYAY